MGTGNTIIGREDKPCPDAPDKTCVFLSGTVKVMPNDGCNIETDVQSAGTIYWTSNTSVTIGGKDFAANQGYSSTFPAGDTIKNRCALDFDTSNPQGAIVNYLEISLK